MAIRELVIQPDEMLNKKCRPVDTFDQKLGILLDDMLDTLYEKDGCGLAAPQVGILRRICVIDIGEGPIELINPEIIKQSGKQNATEGCLSCPGVWGVTERPKKVTVKAFNRFGEEFKLKGEDLLARAFCHEIDHLDGILFTEHVIQYENGDE